MYIISKKLRSSYILYKFKRVEFGIWKVVFQDWLYLMYVFVSKA